MWCCEISVNTLWAGSQGKAAVCISLWKFLRLGTRCECGAELWLKLWGTTSGERGGSDGPLSPGRLSASPSARPPQPGPWARCAVPRLPLAVAGHPGRRFSPRRGAPQSPGLFLPPASPPQSRARHPLPAPSRRARERAASGTGRAEEAEQMAGSGAGIYVPQGACPEPTWSPVRIQLRF